MKTLLIAAVLTMYGTASAASPNNVVSAPIMINTLPAPRPSTATGDVNSRLQRASDLEHGNEQELSQAAAIYLEAGKSGSLEARRSYATLVISHPELENADYASAFSWMKALAEQGDVEAENNFAEMNLSGQGVKPNCHEAFVWFEKAAKQGLMAAEFNLANLYATGRGTDINNAKAFSLYMEAAESSYAPAQNEIGNAYYEGSGVGQDTVAAINWYKRAAAQDLSAAENNLGVVYSQGKGIPADPAEAAKWYLSAAGKGSLAAQNSLGVLYANGRGVALDLTEAQKLFRTAAEKGYAPAQMNLGTMYAKGVGVEQNASQAYFWLMLAQAFGETVPRATLSELRTKLAQTELAQADDQWQGWFRTHYHVQ